LFIRSAIFDAGFQTEQIGTMVIVLVPIDIEVGARVAQIVAHNSNEVENQYNGQWQGDQQRKN
jgi:deoxycytidine triphosphate deaminase